MGHLPVNMVLHGFPGETRRIEVEVESTLTASEIDVAVLRIENQETGSTNPPTETFTVQTTSSGYLLIIETFTIPAIGVYNLFADVTEVGAPTPDLVAKGLLRVTDPERMDVSRSVRAVVRRAHRMLTGSRRERRNRTKAAMDDTQTFVELANPPEINVGDHLGLGTEIVLVETVDLSQNRVTVQRGVDDTIPVAHDANTTVEVKWRWFTIDLLGFLTDEIRSWPDSIFAVGVAPEVTVGVSARAVDIPLTRFRFILEVTAQRSGRDVWVSVPAADRHIKTNLPVAEFPSGNAFTVHRRWRDSRFIVEYAQGFDLQGIEQLEAQTVDIGLSEHLFDAALYGVAWRALAGDEAKRSDTSSQPEPRIAEEVEAGDAIQTASAYKVIRDQRLEEEKRRLRALYPVRFA